MARRRRRQRVPTQAHLQEAGGCNLVFRNKLLVNRLWTFHKVAFHKVEAARVVEEP